MNIVWTEIGKHVIDRGSKAAQQERTATSLDKKERNISIYIIVMQSQAERTRHEWHQQVEEVWRRKIPVLGLHHCHGHAGKARLQRLCNSKMKEVVKP
jgi:hypothetical protein